jgi:hypothetical protein
MQAISSKLPTSVRLHGSQGKAHAEFHHRSVRGFRTEPHSRNWQENMFQAPKAIATNVFAKLPEKFIRPEGRPSGEAAAQLVDGSAGWFSAGFG